MFSAQATEPVRQSFELTITGNVVPASQRVLRVFKGDAVVLRVTSDAAGEVHIHGYRQDVKFATASAAELRFTAHATGRYRIEWHPAVKSSKADHHGSALATLEVRPRE